MGQCNFQTCDLAPERYFVLALKPCVGCCLTKSTLEVASRAGREQSHKKKKSSERKEKGTKGLMYSDAVIDMPWYLAIIVNKSRRYVFLNKPQFLIYSNATRKSLALSEREIETVVNPMPITQSFQSG